MFNPVSSKPDFIAQEHLVLDFWAKSDAFRTLWAKNRGNPHWSFVDGPITANGPMGVHHAWGRTYKDVYQRFHAMRGYDQRYQNGFDCQGLWVEVNVERDLGFKSKRDIEEFGLAEFVNLCKQRVLNFAAIQTEQSIRLGYWMDWNDPDQLRSLRDQLGEDPNQVITVDGPQGPVTGTVEQVVGQLGLPQLGGSYFTFSDENNYLIWAMLKKCWQRGWLYKGRDVMPWCARCGTGISQHEIVTDGYAELTHTSVTLRLPLVDDAGQPRLDAETGLPEALLVWTTTPWTLTSNVAAAVGPELTYVKIKQDGWVYYLAKGAHKRALTGKWQTLGEMAGEALLGWRYRGPFDELPAVQRAFAEHGQAGYTHRVVAWREVGQDEGAGIVHIAPGCGAEDFSLSKEHDLPVIGPVDENGLYLPGFDWLSGRHVQQVAADIFAALDNKGLLYRLEDYTHRYPTCWRCREELIFRLVDEWFISMGEVYDKPREQLSAEEVDRSLRYQIMEVVDQITWIPSFGYERELDWLRNMHDWMISKKRYWGLALPIWVCDDPACGHFHVVGSEHELQERAIAGWDAFAGHTPHRPYIDAVKLACPQCGGQATRIADVGNPWLDAGIVPFSTLGYRQDPEYWRKWFPADWISESFPGQFRNWFYSLLAMSTVMERKPPFLANFGYALLLGEDGREMHKSWGNAVNFHEGAERIGVDVMRWMFLDHKPETNLLFGYHRADETRRRFHIPLWNVYSFFVTYANLATGWQPQPGAWQFWPGGASDEIDSDLASLLSRTREGDVPDLFADAGSVSELAAAPDLFIPFDVAPSPAPTASRVAGAASAAAAAPAAQLDQWIVARLHQTIQGVALHLANYDAQAATGACEVLLDDLSNWYVRRNRRRFWEGDPAALDTLYYVLVTFTRMLAPMMPFVTETLYQNLVRSVYADAPASVHHSDWPQHEPGLVNDSLLADMDLARAVVSLGHADRIAAEIKVRQPLAGIKVVAAGKADSLARFAPIIADELNVKRVDLVQGEAELVQYRILPLNKTLGPRFGKDFPALRQALATADPYAVAAAVNAGQAVQVMLNGEAVSLAPDEVLVQAEPRPGFQVTNDAQRGIVVALDTVITPELRDEGLAREVVRQLQQMRKDAGLALSDRIEVTYHTEDAALAAAIEQQAAYIQQETLTRSLRRAAPVSGSPVQQVDLDGAALTLAIAASDQPDSK